MDTHQPTLSRRGFRNLPHCIAPERMIAEIGLLIDYISGRGTRSLLAPGPPDASAAFADKLGGDPIGQFLRVCHAGAAAAPDPQACETLVLTRDWLNSLASPVTGDTIAFSILVGRIRHGRTTHSDDAETAFPAYVWEAQRMNRQYRWTLFGTRALTAVVFATSAWAIFGTMALGSLADLRTRTELLEQAQSGREATINAGAGTAGPGYVRYCDSAEFREYLAGRNPGYRVVDAEQIGFCSHRDDLTARRDAAYQTLNFWVLGGLPRLGILARDRVSGEVAVREATATITDDAAHAWLSVVSGSILPLFMAMLGSNVAVLRDFFQKIRERLLSPKDRRLYQIRCALGVVAGVAVGFFVAPASPALPATIAAGSATSGALASAAALASTASLSAPALGFVAGFAVDLFFQFLENAAGVLFQRKA